MKSWQTKTLGDLCKTKPQKKEAREKLKPSEEVSFVPMENLRILSKEIDLTQTRKLKDVMGSYTYFADGDVLLAKITPCFENGKLGIATSLKNGIGFGSSEYIVLRSRGEIIPEYLFYFLSQDKVRREGKKVMSGAVGHKRVPKEFIESQILSYPESKDEQKRIVSILDQAFATVETAKQSIEKNQQNANELFQALLSTTFDSRNDSWKNLDIGTLANLTYGYTTKSIDYGDLRYIRITDINKNGRLNLDGKKYINKSADTNKFLLSDGDLLVARTGASFGDVLFFENLEPSIFASYLIKIDFKLPMNNKLFWFFSKSRNYWSQAKKLVSGTAQPHFNSNAISRILFPHPESLDEQKEVVGKLEALEKDYLKLHSLYTQKLSLLDELKQSLLNKAFNGEL